MIAENPSEQTDSNTDPNLELEKLKAKIGNLDKFLGDKHLQGMIDKEKKSEEEELKKQKELESKANDDNMKALVTKIDELTKQVSTLQTTEKTKNLTELRNSLIKRKPELKDNKTFNDANEEQLTMFKQVLDSVDPVIHYNDPGEDSVKDKDKPMVYWNDPTKKKNDNEYQ